MAKRGPAPKPEERREVYVSFRCKPEYKQWLEKVARKRRIKLPQLIDQALAAFAEAEGFETPPDR